MSILRIKSIADLSPELQARNRGAVRPQAADQGTAARVPGSEAGAGAAQGTGSGNAAPAPKRSKYGAKRTTVDGITFDSKAEARRFVRLKQMEAAGEIVDLRLQPEFTLAPSVVIGGRKRPSLRYVADFAYIARDGRQVVEDVKGVITEGFRIKRHLMKAILNIDIEVTK